MMFKKRTTPAAAAAVTTEPWRILLVDDEPEVHSITRLTLGDVEYLGRPLEFLSARSAAEARALLVDAQDIAVAFVDVVMETDRAGLDLVEHIRRDRGDMAMQIVLRTGQPGMAPERQVIREFEINDYLAKTMASADKLYTSTMAALRAYERIRSLQRSREQIERYRDGLETVIDATANLFELRSLRNFASGLLRQLGAMLSGGHQSLIVRAHGVTVMQSGGGFEILARAGRFEGDGDGSLAPEVVQRLERCLAQRRTLLDGDHFVGYFPTNIGIVNLIYLDGVNQDGTVDLRLLDIFSRNISIAFENLYLDRELRETQSELIAMLGDVVETRSNEAANHVRRVSHLAAMLAEAAGLDDEACAIVEAAAPMHDVGKIAIPDHILLKPGALTDAEWGVMRDHARIGQDLLGRSQRPLLHAASIIAGQHHEKYDGSGYPNQLAGERIHPYARIVAIVDVFDALLHPRCYKPAWPIDRVLAHLKEQRGRHFDPVLVDRLIERLDAALAIVARYPDHSTAASPGASDAAPARLVGPRAA